MHSRDRLHANELRVGESGFRHQVADWHPNDRTVFVAPDPVNDLPALAGLVLAFAHAFYDRPEAGVEGFYDYPSSFVIGGKTGAEPRLLHPGAAEDWSEAWCELDVWPNTHHAVSDPDPGALLRTACMLEPTRLVWPERLAVPGHFAPPPSPVNPEQEDMIGLFRRRLKQVVTWSDSIGGDQDGWRVDLRGAALELAREAVRRLPDDAGTGDGAIATAAYRTVSVDRFFATD